MIAKQKFSEMTTAEKLLELARFLVEEVKPKWFDLRSWAEKGFPQKKCGTTACAGGWATVCFPKSGLKLSGFLFLESGLKLKAVSDSGFLFLEYKGYNGFAAVAQFFGITFEQANHLFSPSSYNLRSNKKSNVAKRLRELAKDYR